MNRIMMRKGRILLALAFPLLAIADAKPALELELGRMKLISCSSGTIEGSKITAVPEKAGAVMIPLENTDLSGFNRFKVRIRPLTGSFPDGSLRFALRCNGKYVAGKQLYQSYAGTGKAFEVIFSFDAPADGEVSLARLYFNYAGKITDSVSFELENAAFYQAEAVSKLPFARYHRKLAKTYVFPRIQIKYDLFMNYYDSRHRGIWLERPLFFNRSLAADSRDYSKESNLANFRIQSDLASSYADGFSILATSQSYLARSLAALEFADKLGLKNYVMQEISPAVVKLGPTPKFSDNYDFVYQIIRASAKSPAAFKIDGKTVISSYVADMLPARNWVPIVKKMREEAGGELVFIAEIRALFYQANAEWLRNGGKVSQETVRAIQDYARSYLDVADGILFAGCNHLAASDSTLSHYSFSSDFYRDILIPALVEVMNEPEYRSKYFGLSAAKGYFYKRAAESGVSERGTRTLRESLEAAMAVNPDFIVMPEWNEANENTHIEPTINGSLSNRRIINHFRKVPPPADDNRELPNLLISFRRQLVYGELLHLELLNIPDLKFPAAAYQLELTLKNATGGVLHQFKPLTVDANRFYAEDLTVPSTLFTAERLIVPELKITVDGKTQTVAGLASVLLGTPPNLNKLYVRTPIRDLCRVKTADFKWHGGSGGPVEVAGTLEVESELNSVELLENDIPVAAVDPRKEYAPKNGEDLLRFTWKAASNLPGAEPCVISVDNGELRIPNPHYVYLNEVGSEANSVKGNTLKRRVRAMTYFQEIFFFAPEKTALTIQYGKREFKLEMDEIRKSGVVRKVFPDGLCLAVEQVRRMAELPYPVKSNRVEFRLKAQNIFPNAAYSIRAIAANGRIYRSQPWYPEKSSGRKVKVNVWSYLQDRAETIELPQEFCRRIDYVFNPSAGNILPAKPEYRLFYGLIGGTDMWTRDLDNVKPAPSAPTWQRDGADWALQFNGKGDFLSLPIELISEQSFTLSFTIKPDSAAGRQMVCQAYHRSVAGLELELHDGKLTARFRNRDGKRIQLTGAAELQAGKWSNVTLHYNLERLRLTVNDQTADTACAGLLLRQPALIFGGAVPPKTVTRFKGELKALSYQNY